jgi:hypothetical protein
MPKHAGSGVSDEKASQFVNELWVRASEAGISDERFCELLKGEDAGFMAKIIGVFAEAAGTVVGTVAGTLADYVAACRFDYANPNIVEQNFPIGRMGSPSHEAELVYYGRNMKTEAVHADLAKRGLHPATLLEQLVWCARNPELQRQFPIVALGSDWRGVGGLLVPVLCGNDGRRSLGLYWDGLVSEWDGAFRFLAVRK